MKPEKTRDAISQFFFGGLVFFVPTILVHLTFTHEQLKEAFIAAYRTPPVSIYLFIFRIVLYVTWVWVGGSILDNSGESETPHTNPNPTREHQERVKDNTIAVILSLLIVIGLEILLNYYINQIS